jgi:SPP1 gp7 family putative phage head morphogenesis protein
MGVPFSDLNAAFDLPFDVSDKPWLHQGYQQISLIPTAEGFVFPTGEPTTPAELPPSETPPNEPPEDERPVASARALLQKRRRATAAAFRRLYSAQTRRSMPRLQKAVKKHFEAEAPGVVANVEAEYPALLERYGKSVRAATEKWRTQKQASWTQAETQKHFEKFCRRELKALNDDILSTVYRVDESTKKLVRVLSPVTSDALAASGEAIAAALGLTFDASAEDVAAALDDRANFLSEVSNETFSRVRDSLAGSIERGESVADAAARIEELYETFSSSRSFIIAQTEMGFAFNTADFETMNQSGITEHEWSSAGDDKVRDSHRIDGEKAKIGETFSNGLRYANDPAGEAGEVVNCRCTTLPVVEIPRAAPHRIDKPRHKVLRLSGRRVTLKG